MHEQACAWDDVLSISVISQTGFFAALTTAIMHGSAMSRSIQGDRQLERRTLYTHAADQRCSCRPLSMTRRDGCRRDLEAGA
ncbi:hypothetical protein FKP32DRAFT_169091 [Trametes sanguinea]|nr:hypothetical protein FKP32DRAFT_169091 [Trametes sanguinea]